MKKRELYELGAEAKRSIGELTDKNVLEHVSRSQGITLYDLAKELDWTRGKVLGSLQRLSAQQRVKTKTVLRQGKVVRTIYTVEYEEPRPEVLDIPYKIIELEHWKEVRNVFVHALNRLSFMIEPSSLASFSRIDKRSIFSIRAELEHLENKIRVKLPTNIVDFYQLQNSDTSISSIGDAGDNILVTVEATVIPTAPR